MASALSLSGTHSLSLAPTLSLWHQLTLSLWHPLTLSGTHSLSLLLCAARQAGRQQVISEGGSIRDALLHRPSAHSDMLQRELASMHRCDLTLVSAMARGPH